MRPLLLALTIALVSSAALAQRADITAGHQPVSNSDEAGLWMVFEQVERQTRQSPRLIKDEELNSYLKELVCKLSGPHCSSLRVYLIDNPELNATCAPNGMVSVWTGLLLRVENEAQLAYILGHEITHYVKRHSLNRYQSVRDTSNGLAFLGLGVAGASVGTGINLSGTMDLANLIAIGALFSYNRDQERESDSEGLRLATAAGYDPREASKIWQAIESEVAANPRRRTQLPFISTHPSNEERIQNLTKLGSLHAGTSQIVPNDRFEAVIQRHRAKWLEGELNRGALPESIALLKRLSGSRLNAGLYKYYLAEAYRRRNEAGDLQLAVATYKEAAAHTDVPVEVHRGLGMAALRANLKSEAKAAFTKYISNAPSAADREMVEMYLSRTN